MAGLREKQKANRRQLIEDAASDLFVRKGFNETTIEEIAEQALVSPATVYNYYGTKGILLLALVARGEVGISQEPRAYLDRIDSDDPAEILADLILSNVNDTLDSLSRELWGQVVAYVATTSDEAVGRDYIDTISSGLGRAIEEVVSAMIVKGKLDKSLDPKHFSEMITRLERIHFLNYLYLHHWSRSDLDREIRADLHLIMGGFRA